ncbi:MAG: 3-isopropylmalate dehydrogenase [Clostridium perfringens]|nr:3-isopropylmalate dehydrogenase [Clostridium perfringens]
MREFRIAVIPGDGIGIDVTNEAMDIMEKVATKYDTKLNFSIFKAGGCAIDEFNTPLPKETIEGCRKSHAVLLGAVGGEKWDALPGNERPEKALLGLREGLGLYANLRPATVYNVLKSASPLKDSIIDKGVDILVVRELTGGIYFGKRGQGKEGNIDFAYDTEKYNVEEIKRIAHTAFKAALKRGKKVTSVDKANILESSRLWRKTVLEVAKEYENVELNHLYVDNTAMQLIKNPAQFDVILTNNIFGDILSDEASMITGSIGMLPSASLGEGNFGMYEPIHGSAPDIAGRDIANPIAQILSAAMLFEYSLNMKEAAKDIERAVKSVLDEGYRTSDIYICGMKKVGTKEMGQLILSRL